MLVLPVYKDEAGFICLADKTIINDCDILIGEHCAFLEVCGHSRDKIELDISSSREDVTMHDLMVFINHYKTFERMVKEED